MKIFVNDAPRELEASATLAQFMNGLGLRTFNGVAVAVNETVTPRERWQGHELSAGDRLIIIQAAQGG